MTSTTLVATTTTVPASGATTTTAAPGTTTTTTTLPAAAAACLNPLRSGDVGAAVAPCTSAAQLYPQDGVLHLAAAGATLAAGVLNDPAPLSLASNAGIVVSGSAADVCALAATLPQVFPASTPESGQVLQVARGVGLPLLQSALNILTGYVGGAPSTLDLANLPPCLRASAAGGVEIDDGDVLAARAALQGLVALVHLASAYDIDLPIAPELNGTTTPSDDFAQHKSLLTLEPGAAGELAQAGAQLDAALQDFIAAVDSIDAETDDQSDDLLVIGPADRANLETLRAAATRLRTAITRDATFEASVFARLPRDERVALAGFLSGAVTSLRPLVPGFDKGGNPDPCHFPDYTFGGVTPDLTRSAFDQVTGLTCH